LAPKLGYLSADWHVAAECIGVLRMTLAAGANILAYIYLGHSDCSVRTILGSQISTLAIVFYEARGVH